MRRLRTTHGFTLVEMLVAMVVMGIIGVIMINIFRAQHHAQARQNTGVERTMNARAAVDMMAREMRNAGFDPYGTAAAGFETTKKDDIKWSADLNGDGDTEDFGSGADEVVRYYYDKGSDTIVREVNGTQAVVVDDVTGLTFTYLDAELKETKSGEEVQQVRIAVTYDTPDGVMPGAMETQVAIRNQIFGGAAMGCSVNPTLLVGGKLEISGSAILAGCSKSIHTNGDLKIGGDPIVHGSVSTSGKVKDEDKLQDENGDPVTVETEADEWDIEKITNPTSSHCDDADYHLKANGQIEDLEAGTSYDATSDEVFGWKLDKDSPVVWEYKSDDKYPGTYCVEGSVKFEGTPAKDEADPVEMSIIAKGSIEVSSEPHIAPADDGGYLFLAGGDLKINGDPYGPSTAAIGKMYAYSQCEISGKPRLNSSLVCANNATPGHAVDWADKNKVSGDMELTYACDNDC